MGLSPATVFGCLFDLLYRPTPSVLALYNGTVQELLQPDVIKIGVQVRAGGTAPPRAAPPPGPGRPPRRC
jgi:hypothetical protein